MTIIQKAITLLLSSITFVSCASSKITSSWISPDSGTLLYGKVAVLAITSDIEPGFRLKMEQHMAKDLAALGYAAFAVSEAYGEERFRGKGQSAIIDALRACGADAVITIVLLSKDTSKYFTEMKTPVMPGGEYHGRFWPYYDRLTDRIFAPGYYLEATNYYWESNVYELAEGKLICSLKTASFDPSNVTALAHEYGKMIVGRLSQFAILARVTPATAKEQPR